MNRPLLALALAGLALVALAAQAAELFGIDAQPRWERGALTVSITNWTKLELPVGQLTGTLGVGSGQPCRWTADGGGKLAPGERRQISLADEKAVSECLRKLGKPPKKAASELRFARLPRTQEARADQPLLLIEAEVARGEVKRRASSRWSLDAGAQK